MKKLVVNFRKRGGIVKGAEEIHYSTTLFLISIYTKYHTIISTSHPFLFHTFTFPLREGKKNGVGIKIIMINFMNKFKMKSERVINRSLEIEIFSFWCFLKVEKLN